MADPQQPQNPYADDGQQQPAYGELSNVSNNMPMHFHYPSFHDGIDTRSFLPQDRRIDEILAEVRKGNALLEQVNERLIVLETRSSIDSRHHNDGGDPADEEIMEELPKKLGLPISSTDSFMKVENNAWNLAQLRKYLAEMIGGIEIHSALREFQRATMTDEFIFNNITWILQGDKTKEKIKFSTTKINKAFFGACRMMKKFKKITIEEYEKEMKKVIKNAVQRHYMISYNSQGEKRVQEKRREDNIEAKKRRYEEDFSDDLS